MTTDSLVDHTPSYAAYQRGCRCFECSEISRAYHREWYAKNHAKARASANKRYKKKKRPTLEDRFWPKVDKRGPEECWPWLGASNGGYGLISDGKGKHLRATRASILIHSGPFDKSLIVCHKCDNPPCVNPNHLFLGTFKDNMKDMHRKNRGYAKLTWQQRRELLSRYTPRGNGSSGNVNALAKEYGLSADYIRCMYSKARKNGIILADGTIIPDEDDDIE